MIQTFLIVRSIEVIFSMILGAFLCFLGYLLFRNHILTKSNVKVEHQNTNLFINASPGIFFSIFGATIISISIWHMNTFEYSKSFPGSEKIMITKNIGDDITSDEEAEMIFDKATQLQLSNKDGAEDLYLQITGVRLTLKSTLVSY